MLLASPVHQLAAVVFLSTTLTPVDPAGVAATSDSGQRVSTKASLWLLWVFAMASMIEPAAGANVCPAGWTLYQDTSGTHYHVCEVVV